MRYVGTACVLCNLQWRSEPSDHVRVRALYEQNPDQFQTAVSDGVVQYGCITTVLQPHDPPFANSFAHLAASARVACSEESSVRKVDMGFSGDRYFIHRVGIGLDADKVNRATRELKRQYGVLAYSIGWLQAAPETPIARYHLRIDGKDVEVEGVTCHIANSGSIGVPGHVLLPDISVSDGMLDVLVIRDTSIGTALSIGRLAMGHPVDPTAFYHWQAREVTVMADPPQRVQADGEMWETTPITAGVLPGAVSIVTPAPLPHRREMNDERTTE